MIDYVDLLRELRDRDDRPFMAAAADAIEALQAECERLREELAAAQKDAKRYQWLRGRVPGSAYRIMGVIYSEGGKGVDKAIDAAMAQEKSE